VDGAAIAVAGSCWCAAAAIVQFDRQRFLERRTRDTALQERSCAEQQQPAPPEADEVGKQFHLRPPEELALQVPDDDGVVREQ
jgi:hypothetical protein